MVELTTPDELLPTILQRAADRFHSGLKAALPGTAPLLNKWLRRVPAHPKTVEVCLAVRSFPAFYLPYWLALQRGRPVETRFLEDVAYSTLNGYYFVRLLDNVSDGDGPPELKRLLPAGGYFCAEFHAPYQQYFPPDHPFWGLFRAAWNEQAEAASTESEIGDITQSRFLSVSARKFSAAKGPLAAAAFHYGLQDQLPPWNDFVDRLGAFSQLVNDLFDWHHDCVSGIPSFVQSEYLRRRAAAEESIHCWIVRDGFDRGANTLRSWLEDLRHRAEALGSPGAVQWVNQRRTLLEDEVKRGKDGLRVLNSLASMFDLENSS